MAKLTKHSMGLTDGFASGYRRDDLVNKLGAIEYLGEDLISQVCDEVCRHSKDELDQYELDDICAACPMSRLMELIE